MRLKACMFGLNVQVTWIRGKLQSRIGFSFLVPLVAQMDILKKIHRLLNIIDLSRKAERVFELVLFFDFAVLV